MGAKATAPEILDANPDVAAFEGIKQLLSATGEITTDLTNLTSLVQQNFTKIAGQLDIANSKLDSILNSQDLVVQGVGFLVATEIQRQELEREMKAHKAVVDGASAGVQLVAGLIGVADPKLGRQFAAVGNGAVQIVDAIVSFAKASAGKAAMEAIFNLGTAALTDNVVQAALTIVTAFIDAGPTVEQMILDQLQEVQKQIDRLVLLCRNSSGLRPLARLLYLYFL